MTEGGSGRSRCPFCGAEWTDAMLAELDSVTLPSSCACCAGPAHGDALGDDEAAALPTRDICCATCGKPIYRAMPSLTHS